MIPGRIAVVTPSDTDILEGVSVLLCTVAGNVVLKGTQQGAAPVPAFAMGVGQQIYVPGKCFVMATGTTASLVAMG